MRPSIDTDTDITKITEDLLKGKTQFLFGAGMSKSCDLPIGNKLSFLLLKEFNSAASGYQLKDPELKQLSSQFPFEVLFEIKEKEVNRQKITDFLTRTLINVSDEKVNELDNAYSLLNEIRDQTGYPKVILTTNFDLLFEKRFGEVAKTISKRNFHEAENFKESNDVPIIHIHGILSDEKYTVTEKDIFSAEYNPMMREFEKWLYQSDSFVFVGYSMSDPNIKALYRKYMTDIEYRSMHDKKIFVVYPPSDQLSEDALNVENRYHRLLWEKRNAIWIPMNANEFFKVVREKLQKLKTSEVRKEIIRQYGGPDKMDEDELTNKIERLKIILQTDDANAIGFLKETVK